MLHTWNAFDAGRVMMRERLLGTHAEVDADEQSEGHPIADVRVELSPYASFSTSYHHQDRLLTAREPLILPGAFFKWYELRPADEPNPGRSFPGRQSVSRR